MGTKNTTDILEAMGIFSLIFAILIGLFLSASYLKNAMEIGECESLCDSFKVAMTTDSECICLKNNNCTVEKKLQ